MTLLDFLKRVSSQIEALEKKSNEGWWNLSTTGDSKYEKEVQEVNIALRKLYSSSDDYQFLLSHKNEKDPVVARQIKLLIDRYCENQISPEAIEKMVKLETEIETTFTNFRAKVGGKEISNNDLKEILIESVDNDQRRQVWEASKVIGEEVEKKVLQLIHLRNESARTAGFSNYYTMRLELQELDEKELFDLIHELDLLTLPHWKEYKREIDESLSQRYQISSKELMPWHYQDPFFQEAPAQALDLDGFYKGKDIAAISQMYFEAIGLPVEQILADSDLYERDKKNQHAFCLSIDHKEDVRILCNLRDNEYWMGTQLHELGHAVYHKYIDLTLPYLLRTYPHTSTTEAIAMLFGRFSQCGEFLKEYCGVSDKDAAAVAAVSQKQIAANLLVFARWVMVMVHFERAMYQNPQADLNKLWWDYVEKFQWVQCPNGRNKPDWGAKLHLACAPVYYQNYLLGEMTSSQLIHYLKEELEVDLFHSPKVGEYLTKRLFSLGAKYPWTTALTKATDESLNPSYFAEDVKYATSAHTS